MPPSSPGIARVRPNRRWHVLGLGCLAIDYGIVLDRFPDADEKVPMRSLGWRIGGTTGTALMAAARFATQTAYAGNWGPRFHLHEATFRQLAIDFQPTTHCLAARPIESVTMTMRTADVNDRRVAYSLEGVLPLADEGPSEDVVAATDVLLVDHFGMRGMIRACEIARRYGIPIVADFESDARPEFAELLALPDHLIVNHAFATRITGQAEPAKAARDLAQTRHGPRTVVITTGGDGCVYIEPDLEQATSYRVAAPLAGDSTGCGDVFHGVYAASLALKLPLAERLRHASMAARLWMARESFSSFPPDRMSIASALRVL